MNKKVGKGLIGMVLAITNAIYRVCNDMAIPQSEHYD